MDAYCAVNFGVLFGEFDCSFKRPTVWIPGADVEHSRHTSVERPTDHFIAIVIVFSTVDVTMRISEVHFISNQCRS